MHAGGVHYPRVCVNLRFACCQLSVGAMAQAAPVDCLHMCWLKDRELCERLDEGGRLVKAMDGGMFVKASEEHCVFNRGLLEAYMVRQRASQSLDIPDLESLKSQLVALHVTRAGQRLRGTKKPKALLEATMELVQANSHLDAKAIKRLLSYARHRFLKEQSVRESFMQGVRPV